MEAELRLMTEFLGNHPASAGQILDRLSSADAAAVLADVPEEAAAAGLGSMSPVHARDCIQEMRVNQAAALLSILPTEAAAGLLRRVTEETRDGILANIELRLSRPLQRMLSYPADTAGALADPLPPVLAEDMTVGEALDELGRYPARTFVHVYVVDRSGKLRGAVTPGDLVVADSAAVLGSLAKYEVPTFAPMAPLRAVASHPGWKEYDELPVVDRSGILVGAIRHRALRLRQAGKAERVREAGGLGAILGLGEFLWTGMYDVLEGTASGVESGRRESGAEGEGRNNE